MSFEARLNKQREAVGDRETERTLEEQLAKEEKEKQDVAAIEQRESHYASELERIQASPEYKHMSEIANSKELHEALLAYSKTFSKDAPTPEVIFKYKDLTKEHPFGFYVINLTIIESGYTDGEYSVRIGWEGIKIYITCDEAGSYSFILNLNNNGFSTKGLTYINRFEDLDSLLDFIALQIAKKEQGIKSRIYGYVLMDGGYKILTHFDSPKDAKDFFDKFVEKFKDNFTVTFSGSKAKYPNGYLQGSGSAPYFNSLTEEMADYIRQELE